MTDIITNGAFPSVSFIEGKVTYLLFIDFVLNRANKEWSMEKNIAIDKISLMKCSNQKPFLSSMIIIHTIDVITWCHSLMNRMHHNALITNQRPVIRSLDRSRPIKGQCPVHVISTNQRPVSRLLNNSWSINCYPSTPPPHLNV